MKTERTPYLAIFHIGWLLMIPKRKKKHTKDFTALHRHNAAQNLAANPGLLAAFSKPANKICLQATR